MGRSRLLVAAILALALVAAGAWHLVGRALDVDQYRPEVEKEIERLTGLPVSIGAFELQLRPLLRFSALDVSIGDGELRASAPRIDAYPRFRPLLERRVEIASIQVSELGLRLPEDPARLGERWQDIERRLEAALESSPDEAPSAFLSSVGQIRAGSASLRLGAGESERLRASAVARGLSGPSPTLELELELPYTAGQTGSLRAALRVEGETREDLRLGFRGSLDPLRPWAPPLDFSGRARLVGGELGVEELRADGEDFEARGSALVRGAGAGWLRLDTVRAGGAPLAAALEALDLGAVALSAAPDAGLEGRGLVVELAEEGPPALVAGELEALGLEARLAGERLGEGIAVRAGFEAGEVRITQLRGGPFALTGRLRPAPDWSRAELTLAGELGLTRALLGLGGPPDEVVDRVSELELEASLDAARIEVAGRGRSPVLGALSLEQSTDLDADRLRGALTLDLGAVAGYLEAGPLRDGIEPLLRAYGPSRLEIAVEGLASDAPRVRVERPEAPGLRAELTLRPADAGGPTLTLASGLPAAALGGVLPGWLSARGTGALRLDRDTASERFTLELDLGGIHLAAGELLDKQRGESLSVALEGAAPETGWSAGELRVAGEAATLRLDLEDEGIAARDLDLDLAAWSFLFAEAWRARGRIAGSFSSEAPRFDLTLSGVGLERSEQAVVAGLEGRLSGAGSLDGRLAAAELDVDRLLELRDRVAKLLPADAEAGVWPRGGQLALRLGRMAVGRSRARGVGARVGFSESDIEVRDIAFETYEGRVAGSLAWLGRQKPQPRLDLRLDLAGVTGRFLDDMLFDEPRGIRGVFDGELRFAAPYRGDIRATLAGGSGLLAFTGRKGTLGRIGLATKLITVLRSTEALQLRLPSLRDEGLVFDELRANLAMEAGELEVERFELDSPSYAITATGVLDYAADRSRLDIEVDVIKGLTPLIGRVPIASDTLKIMNLRLRAEGPPQDMTLHLASTRDQILGVSRAGERVVVNGVRDALRLFRVAPSSPQDPEPPEADRSGLPLEP